MKLFIGLPRRYTSRNDNAHTPSLRGTKQSKKTSTLRAAAFSREHSVAEEQGRAFIGSPRYTRDDKAGPSLREKPLAANIVWREAI